MNPTGLYKTIMNIAFKALSHFFSPAEQPAVRTPAPLPTTDVSMAVRYLADGPHGDELAVATVIMENVSGTPCFTGSAPVTQGKYARQVAAMEAADEAREKALAAGYAISEVSWQVRATCTAVERPLAKVLQFKR